MRRVVIHLSIVWAFSGVSAFARTTAVPADANAAIDEAAATFALPRVWIERVIAAESGGDRYAVSSAGARGLMQLMPATWQSLRFRLRLGTDPFDVHDNVIAGAAYLREMFDLFGAPAFLAAYHAGPGRYARYLAGEARLGPATRAYVRLLSARAFPPRSTARSPWASSSLFPIKAEPNETGDRLD